MAQAAQAESSPPAGLRSDAWTSVKLMKKENVNYNTVSLRFGLEDSNQTAGLSVASCLVLRAPIGDQKDDGSKEMVIRPYTPTSEPGAKGFFDLVVKVYPKGNISKVLGDMKEGDTIEAKGPIPKLEYKPNKWKKIGMIAGGSGITPMLQVAEEIMRHPEDKTDVSLIFANTSPKDILLRDRLDKLAKDHDNFSVYYVVDDAPKDWQGGTGYVDKPKIEEHCPAPGDGTLICVCGPPPMYKAICGMKAEDKSQGELSGTLKDMGYTKDMVFKF